MPRPTPRSLVRRLLADRALEPADWAQGSRPAGSGRLAQLGVPVAASLRAYAKAAEMPAFRAAVAALISSGGGFYWSVWPVCVPTQLPTRLGRSALVTLLAGCVPLAIDPDSGAFVIADWRTSAVASFLFDDVAPSDPEPGDFVFEATSLARFLAAYGDPARRPRRNATGHEIARLYRRGIWLAHLLCKAEVDPDLDDIVRTGRDASPLDVYRRERTRFATHPHYALYWLLAFAVTGARDHLADALARSRRVRAPVVAAVRAHLATGRDLLAHRRRTWPVRDRDAVLAAIAGAVTPSRNRTATGTSAGGSARTR